MPRVNLNKSEELVTNTTVASKYNVHTYLRGLESGSIEIPPFQTSLHRIQVNLTSQHSHLDLEVLLLSKFWSERRDFN